MTRVLHPSKQDLLDQRERLLARARVSSREELARRAEAGELSADEFWAWENIQSIDFLLGADGDEGGDAA